MKTKVLVIDADAAIRESANQILEREGYEVLLAADGQEAVSRFDPQQIDMLLLDINLPVRHGWDAFEEITARNPSMPVIVITGDYGQYVTAKAAGASAFIEKPIDPVLLLQTIQELLVEPKENRPRRPRLCRAYSRYLPANAQRVFEDLRTRCSTPYEWEIPSRVFQPVQPPARWKSPARNIAPHRGETDDSSETEPGIGQGSPAPAHPNQPPEKE